MVKQEDPNLGSYDKKFKELLHPDDYQYLFRQLDVQHNGEITLEDFRRALVDLDHPIKNNPELTEKIFHSFDANNDEVIDFNDFKLYLTTTDDQILRGFNKIDEDHDGPNLYLYYQSNSGYTKCNRKLINKLACFPTAYEV